MTRTRSDLATLKMKAFEIIAGNRDITGDDLAARLGVVRQTAYKYKKEFNDMVDQATLKVATEVHEKTKEDNGIWMILRKFLRIK